MPTIGELNVKVGAHTSPFRKAITGAQRDARSFSKTVSKSMSGAMSRFSGVMGGVVGQLGLFAGATGVAAAIGASIKLAASAEQTEVAFKTLLGSTEAARKSLKELRTFSNSTPFEFTEVADAGKKLLAFGTSAGNLLPTMRSIGDVASGLGIKFGELSEIYGKIQVQGRVYAEDINQLQGRGIPIVQELAKSYGKTNEEIKKMVSDGKVGFSDIETAFQSMSGEGGKFFNMMEEQSKTLAGSFSTLKGNVASAMTEIGTSIASALDLTGFTQQVNDYFAAWEKGQGPIAAANEGFQRIMLNLESMGIRFQLAMAEVDNMLSRFPGQQINAAKFLRGSRTTEQLQKALEATELQKLHLDRRSKERLNAEGRPDIKNLGIGADLLKAAMKPEAGTAKRMEGGKFDVLTDMSIAGIVRKANEESARFGQNKSGGGIAGAVQFGTAAAAGAIARASAGIGERQVQLLNRIEVHLAAIRDNNGDLIPGHNDVLQGFSF